MEGMNIVLENIKKKFERYETYYQVLSIEKLNVDDKIVKEAYERKCKQLNMLFKGLMGEEIEQIKEKIQMALDNAYVALKTEDSRKNYQELLDRIEKKEEESER